MFILIRAGLNLKRKKNTLKYYIFQICLLSIHKFEDSGKILFITVLKIIETQTVENQLNWSAQPYEDNRVLESAAESSPVLLLTL